MTIKRARRFPIYKLLLSGFAALTFVLQPFSGIALAIGTTKTVCLTPDTCDYTTIPDAIAGAASGDTINVQAGEYAITTNTAVTKQLTINGAPGAVIKTSGAAKLFTFLADGTTFDGFTITKTDKTGQNIIGIQAANTTISNNNFSGQYALGDGEVARALEVSTTTGVSITGNSFTGLRQPAYVNDNTTGSITNNYVNGTRGWVLVANTNFTFSGNTWGTNAVDIAFIKTTPTTPTLNNYPCPVMETIKANNSAPIIDNQTLTSPCPLDTVAPAITGQTITNNAIWGSGYDLPSKPNHVSESTGRTVVGGTVQVGANFSDNLLLTNIFALLPGRGFFADSEFTPVPVNNHSWFGVAAGNYAVTWDTKTGTDWRAVPDGNYTFKFNARDGGNGQNQPQNNSELDIDVTVDNTAPTVSFTGSTPAENALVHGTINASGNFTDANGLMNTDIGIHAVAWKCHTDWPAQGQKDCAIDTTTLADGTYQLTMAGRDKAGNVTQVFRTIRVDNSAPTGLTHLSPADKSFMTTAAALSIDWTDATDPHGLLSYYYESSTGDSTNPDGSFVAPIFQSGALNTSQIPTPNTPVGIYYWHVRAADALGNSTPWTSAWRVTIDNTKPTIVVNTVNGTVNPATISVTGTDNTELQTVTAHIYNENLTALVKPCSTNVPALNTNEYELSCSTAGLANGVYTIKTNAKDKAGNLSITLSSTKFIIDHTDPNVTALDFGTWGTASPNFKAINVGFELDHFKTVTDITVDLYDASGKFVTNTASSAFLALINANNLTSLSSPFVVSGTLDDTFCAGGPCWNAGAHNWTTANKPVKAVVTVGGTRLSNEEFTDNDDTTIFAESDGTFESLLPAVLGDNTGFGGDSPSLSNAFAPLAQLAVTPLSNSSAGDSESGSLTAADIQNAQTTTAKTLAATDTAPVSDDDTTDAPVSGLAWYWWVLIAAAVIGVLSWIIAALRRRNSDNA